MNDVVLFSKKQAGRHAREGEIVGLARTVHRS
jgi:hypothetical protein